MIEKISIQGYRIYRDFKLQPNPGLNLVVGPNESGKSTLLEAVALALTGRINGRWASEEVNPHWFNADVVEEFVEALGNGMTPAWPTIRIELFLEDRDDLQELSGTINSAVPTMACPGITLRIIPSDDYADELSEWAKKPSRLLPVDYYRVDWRSFADAVLTRRPRQLATAVIDSRTVRSSSGVDYHLRQILNDQLQPNERAAISLAYREVKASMSEDALKAVNERMSALHAALHDQPIELAMDQTSRTSWEGAVTPHVKNVPFAMSGQGQQAAIKISLAMSRHSDTASFVMVEEPENHLTFASLTVLLSRMESLAGDQQQLFVTTHSSFVLNRLGIDTLQLLGAAGARKLAALSESTVRYFQKLPGYDTLRMALADKVVLVEGPSDEIIFERVFKDRFGHRPLQAGIDVLSIRGLSLARCLELCRALDKPVAALRDNDGMDPSELTAALEEWLTDGRRELFVGSVEGGATLEPQLVFANGDQQIRSLLGITEAADLATWMERQKTEGALRIAEAGAPLTPPSYMASAADFIHEC